LRDKIFHNFTLQTDMGDYFFNNLALLIELKEKGEFEL